ncbi:uncharacterized protein [Diadema antillarum]|uniref:uncharacterized protein n=1 Tax=Diadema antillarum TaxID=105358 RepID=UPI003A8C30B9
MAYFADSAFSNWSQVDLDLSSLMTSDGNGVFKAMTPSLSVFDEDLDLYSVSDSGEKDAVYSSHLQASPSSLTSDDIPTSPLSEGIEDMQMQRSPPLTSPEDIYGSLLRQVEEDEAAAESPDRDEHLGDTSHGEQFLSAMPDKPRSEVPLPPLSRGVHQAATATTPAPEMGSHPCNGQKAVSNKVNKRGVKRKAVQVEEEKFEENVTDPTLSRNLKNALAARENRLKKKKEWEYLKIQNSSLEKENQALRKDNQEHVETIAELEEQLRYYKSVLVNQSALSNLLQSMNPIPNLSLSSSTPKTKHARLQAAETQGMSGGVCLHVNGPQASLEFCSRCSRNAKCSFDS